MGICTALHGYTEHQGSRKWRSSGFDLSLHVQLFKTDYSIDDLCLLGLVRSALPRSLSSLSKARA